MEANKGLASFWAPSDQGLTRLMRLMNSWAPSDRIVYKAASFTWGPLAYVAVRFIYRFDEIGLVQI